MVYSPWFNFSPSLSPIIFNGHGLHVQCMYMYLVSVSSGDAVVGGSEVRRCHNEVHVEVGIVILGGSHDVT